MKTMVINVGGTSPLRWAAAFSIGVWVLAGWLWAADRPLPKSGSSARSPVPMDLFKTWEFDKQPAGNQPVGFTPVSVGAGDTGIWMVQADAGAPSSPNIVRQSAPCTADPCMHLLLVDDLVYEYPDVSVKIRLTESPIGPPGAAGLVFGARGGKNFYAATVDLTGEHIEVLRVVDGKPTVLAQTTAKPKQVAWHVLRVRRDTIISKEYIEVVYDGVHVLSFEDTTLEPGQIGIITRGPAMVAFDNVHAAPLYSQKPLSPPAAY
ncbi:hypothetical protein [Candidatus Nitrospira bockiana]